MTARDASRGRTTGPAARLIAPERHYYETNEITANRTARRSEGMKGEPSDKDDSPERNGGKNDTKKEQEKGRKEKKKKKRRTATRRGSSEAEAAKFLKPPNLFSAEPRQRLPRPRRLRSNTLRSASLSSATDSIYRRRISSREISRAISATDFYAAITPRFSFLFSTSCASSYNHSHIHLQWKRKVGSPRTANPLRALYCRRVYTVYPGLIRECRRTYARETGWRISSINMYFQTLSRPSSRIALITTGNVGTAATRFSQFASARNHSPMIYSKQPMFPARIH